MGPFAKKFMWASTFGLAGILSLGAPGRAVADDGGAKDSAAKDASTGPAKTDSRSGAKAEKKADAPAALTERERMLLDRVEQLERRVEELEAKSAGTKKADETTEAVSGSKSESSVTTNSSGLAVANGSIAANQNTKSASSVDLADKGRSNAAPLHGLAGSASEVTAPAARESTSVAATSKTSSVAMDPSLDAAVAIGAHDPGKPKKAEPFAFADWTWMNGNPRTKDIPLDTKFFTPEIRVDAGYVYDFNHPKDDTIGGSAEVFRAQEFQLTQLGVGGDFHYDNVRGRLMTQFGMYSQTQPRNDASPSRGQWGLDGAYRYLAEAYGGYHFDVMHGVNVDAGIFLSYIGLFSWYNFDNWAYQPSYVSSNTPFFFNGLRVQTFPTEKLKVEGWLINGWQSYGRFNGRLGVGFSVNYRPNGKVTFVSNGYLAGEDAFNTPGRVRYHSDNSVQVKYYDKPENGLDKMAFSLTGDIGCEHGGGVSCYTNSAKGPKQDFLGYMIYQRFWFDHDRYGLTLGGGQINNPGRYLVLLPPINGATAASGTPYFTENPGDPFKAWDASATFDYMPKQYITFRTEFDHRAANVPYFSGPGGITPTSCPTSPLVENICGTPGSLVPGFAPDLKKIENRIDLSILVKF
ncbi:MAG TPA: outer membrane beta-barrel protein [Candidatus Acidoferrum sp.]|nr:outer membrane beta-barrel protein [Candidatus Acidoferrum sp.]